MRINRPTNIINTKRHKSTITIKSSHIPIYPLYPMFSALLPRLGRPLTIGLSASMSKRRFGALQSYRSALDSHPMLVKSITASVLSFSADIICQLVVPYIKEKENGSNSGFSFNLSNIDWIRTAKFSLLGATLNGGLLHYWYQVCMNYILRIY